MRTDPRITCAAAALLFGGGITGQWLVGMTLYDAISEDICPSGVAVGCGGCWGRGRDECECNFVILVTAAEGELGNGGGGTSRDMAVF